MATTTRRVRPVSHEDRLSLVEHLDELRSRLMTCAGILVGAFGFSLWQQNNLLHILNVPLEGATNTNGKGTLEQNAKFQKQVKIALGETSDALGAVAAGAPPSPERTQLQQSIKKLDAAVAAMP